MYYYADYNLTVYNFTELFEKEILPLIVETSIKFDLSGSKDFNRFLMHCTVLKLCEACSSITNNSKIKFYYNETDPNLVRHFADGCTKSLTSIIHKCKKYLPLSWYVSSKPYYFYNTIILENRGVSFLREMCNKTDKNGYTFAKAQKFAKKYGLTFLDENIFSCLKIRYQLLNT